MKPWEKYSQSESQAVEPWRRYGVGGSPTPSLNAASRADSGPAEVGSGPVDLAEGMPWWEKVLVGTGGGMRNVYLGAKSLVGQGTEEEKQERKDWTKNKEDLGWQGTLGEVIGEGVATLPVGGAVGAGAKIAGNVLPKAVQMGANTWKGLAARGAVEGAASNVIAGSGDQTVGENAQEGAVTGGIVGSVLPKTLKGAAKFARGVATELSPTARAASNRGYNALARTLGKERLNTVVDQVEGATPSMLPRTTAAMSQDPRMGSLERGARSRGNVDFSPHDEAVSREAWKIMQGATDQADQISALVKGGTDVMTEGKDLMNKLPLSQDRRANISQQMLDLRNSSEVIANPQLAKELDNVIGAMDNPEATLEVLPQLYWRLGQEAGDSSAIQKARSILKEAADERSQGQFTNMQEGYGVTMDQLKAAEAAKRLRDKFSVEELPATTQYYGDSGVDAIPQMTSAPLRRGMIAEAKKGGLQEMDPAKVNEMNILADQLRAHEIYKPTYASGGANLEMGLAEGAASTALNAGPLWRLRGALGSAFSDLNDKTQKAVDQALLNPDDFLKMVEQKQALGKALAPWEAKLDELIRGVVRSTAIEE